ncbi:MAG: radical SAM protein, partial [Muribaculaceae bacterium]|nr:radical SAM protein [Muribaculaceae bacterium]
QELDRVEGIERYRISSIEPDLLTDEIIDFVARSRAFMPHFHIPLQCGSDTVLRLMRRRYDTALFAEKIERIRRAMPHAFIGIDIIAGARGETEEEFERSLGFVGSLDITRLHVFPYSERPGTKALEIPHQVTREEKQRRVARLMRLSEEKLGEFSARFLGQTRPVLLERPKPGHPTAGFTDNYLRVSVTDARPELDNRIVGVRLDEIVTGSGGEPEFIGHLDPSL